MPTPSPIREKSYAFALRIVKCYQHLITEKKEYVLAKQLLRSGTSIGAHIREAGAAYSKREFIYKFQLSLKEAHETHFWIHLLKDSDYLEPKVAKSLIIDCEKIIWLLSRSIKTARANLKLENRSTE